MKKLTLLLVLVFISFSAFGQETHAFLILEGRRLEMSPSIFLTSKQKGIVVVSIDVDRNGRVTKAQVNPVGTTIKNESVLSDATATASRFRFIPKAYAPVSQPGAIIFSSGQDIPNDLITRLTETYHNESILTEVVDEDAIKFLGIPVDGSKEFVVGQLVEKGFKLSYDETLDGQFNGDPVKIYIHTYRDKVDRIIVEFNKVPEMDLREQYNHLLSLLMKNEKYHPVSSYSPLPEDEDCNYELFVHNKDYKAVFSYIPDGEVWLTILDRGGYHVCLYYDNLRNRPHGEDL